MLYVTLGFNDGTKAGMGVWWLVIIGSFPGLDIANIEAFDKAA